MISLARYVFVLLLLSLLASGAAAQTTATEDCPASQFQEWGAIGVVAPGAANNLRAEPSPSAARIGRMEAGTVFRVRYQTARCAEGYLWIEVETLSLSGWTVERALDDDKPFLIPYEAPEPELVSSLAEDGSLLVEGGGVRFVVPAALEIAEVWMAVQIGLFGDVMSAQPSSLVFIFLNAEERRRGAIEIYPFAVSDATYAYWEWATDFPMLLDEQPPLLEYAARNRMPQLPIAGVAALFGGAPIYAPLADGPGLRYITYFAQDYVIFTAEMGYTYLYRGLTADRDFLIAGEFGVRVPASTIPGAVNRGDDSAYSAYLRRFEANLAAQPTSAFTPDLALYDAIFASLELTDAAALLARLP